MQEAVLGNGIVPKTLGTVSQICGFLFFLLILNSKHRWHDAHTKEKSQTIEMWYGRAGEWFRLCMVF